MKRVMLYFGSFNPVHKGHIALAEYVVEQGLCDEAVLVVSPQSPYKRAAELAPEMDRFEMAERACAASRLPERIKPSVVEFLLPKPSYTIDTLRYLTENHGAEMEFSILMGADQLERLDGWKEYEKILEYPIYVYPRRGEQVGRFAGRFFGRRFVRPFGNLFGDRGRHCRRRVRRLRLRLFGLRFGEIVFVDEIDRIEEASQGVLVHHLLFHRHHLYIF